MRQFSGKVKIAVAVWGFLLSAIQFYTAGFGILEPRLQRGIHVTMLMPLAFVLFPATRRSPEDRITWMDGLLAFLSLLPGGYILINHATLNERWEFVTPVTTAELILGSMVILLLLEATRRSVAPALAYVVGGALVFLVVGPWLPGMAHHQGFAFSRLIEMMYLLVDDGVYGIITGVSATFAYIFVLFGAIILVTGTGDFFTNVATAVAGRATGGPAKVAVVSSGLFGMVSGVGVSNVYATGSFTIPMMMKMGYRPEFAAAVEACAGSGGQYMPPIMGAGAFIMAELVGQPYAVIAMSAFLSAIIYYVGVFGVVHFEAKRTGLVGLPVDQLPRFADFKRQSYLVLPVIGMAYLLITGWSAIMAGFWAVILSILSSFLGRKTWVTPKRLFWAMSTAANNAIMMGISCAAAGIVVSAITHTGIGLAFTSGIVTLSGGNLFLALLMVVGACFILATGLPTTAAYILTAALTAPALVNMGVDLLAAHLFAFYFATISCITPPEGTCFYAAASLAKANPWKTGWEATKIGLSGYIVPFMFVYEPALIMRPLSWMTLWMFIAAFICAMVASAAVAGYWFGCRIPNWERILLVGLAVTFAAPEFWSTVISGLAIAAVIFYHKRIRPIPV